jgi:hypothetical protein
MLTSENDEPMSGQSKREMKVFLDGDADWIAQTIEAIKKTRYAEHWRIK